VTFETGAGLEAGFPDDAYANAGAHLADLQQVLDGSAVIAKVRAPDASQTPRAGGVLISLGGRDAGLEKRLQERPVSHLALERVPRTSRAQTMDVLSSQASVAGYVAVLEGAGLLDILLPMLTTAAGIIKPAKMIALGAGVAGLQAIATARRLGAIVSGTDVRPAAKEEIKSLGAAFVGVEDEETAGQTGAYAKEMSDAFRQKQAELMATTVAKNDLVICTALVQGRKAPVIVTQPMVDSMKAGSVVVDLAAEAGGNCAATVPGEAITTHNGVRVLGYRNWPGRIAVAASNLYARNLLTFLSTFWDKESQRPNLPDSDEIIKGVMLTRGGQVVHAQFQPAQAA
jgi:NAD(P) transhydrogenase subunit alpha